MTEQLFYILAGTAGIIGVFGIALLGVWAFGGDKIRQQIREEW